MTTYPIDFIAKTATTERLSLTRRQSVTESPTTYAVQVVQSGSQWQLQWAWPRMAHATAEAVHAWTLRLKGQIGSFRYYPRLAGGSGLTTITLAQIAYGYNDTLLATGFTANAPSTLRAGQYFQLGNQLLCVTDAGALADANGHVTITFEPELRINYAAATALNFTHPSGVFRLNASEGLGYTLDPDHRPEFSAMTAREVVNA